MTSVLAAASAIVTQLLELDWTPDISGPLLAIGVMSGLGVAAPTRELYALVARDTRLHEAPPERALQVQLGALLGLAPVTDVSVWRLLANGKLHCLQHLGINAASRRTRQAAFDVLHGAPPRKTGKRIRIHAFPVTVHGRTRASLVVRWRTGDHDAAAGHAEECADALAPTLARWALLDRLRAQQGLLESAEKRVTRVGLDLHDGPLQRVSVLMGEIENLRNQLSGYKERLHDQESLARSVDEQLRQLVSTLPRNSARRELEAVLKREIRVFGRSSDVDVRFSTRGTAWPTTRSQRIAMARIAQEALANVREHSGATGADVSLTYGRSAITLRIADDGRGFDAANANGTQTNRFGLSVMAERTQLLDGVFEIESQPGGPTVISAVLPRFELDAAQGRGEDGVRLTDPLPVARSSAAG